MERFATEKALLCSGLDSQSRKNLFRCIVKAEKAEKEGDRERIAAASKALRNAASRVRPLVTEKLDGTLPESVFIYAGGRKSADFPLRDAPPCDGIRRGSVLSDGYPAAARGRKAYAFLRYAPPRDKERGTHRRRARVGGGYRGARNAALVLPRADGEGQPHALRGNARLRAPQRQVL